MKLLLARGGNINDKDKKGFTTLMLVVQVRQKDAVDAMERLRKEADLHERGKEGISRLLMMTANVRKEEMMELLLNAGANIHDTNKTGDTALKMVAAKGLKGMVELLLDRGADQEFKQKASD